MLYLLLLAFIVGCIMLNAIGKPPGLPTATVRTETETVGSVRAELTIGHDVTLRIWRRGQLAFSQPLTILQTSTYDGPSGFDIRVDGQGEPFVRIGVVAATSAGQKRFPDDLRLEYRFDRIGRHYVASLIPGKFRDPLWSGTVAIRDVTRAGDLQITASYSLKNDEFVRVGPTLSVARQGVAVPIGPLPSGIRGPLSGSPVIVDLNNDAELEIVYSLSMLGTNCCSEQVIYRYDHAERRYIRTTQVWGYYRDAPKPQDLTGDGIINFVGTNEDITSRFAPGCCSGPGVIRIGRFGHDGIVWVTRSYPKLIRADAWDAWRAIVETARRQPALQPAATAWYLADKLMLGEGADGWANARRTYSPSRWVKLAPQLQRALQTAGYGSPSFPTQASDTK